MTTPHPDHLLAPNPLPAGFVSAATLVAEPVEWLWHGRLPLGALVVIDGDPGLGKSTLVYDIAARVSTGRTMPDGTPGVEASAVIVASAEDDPNRVIAPRLDAAGADRERIAIPAIGELPYLDGAWLDQLDALAEQTGARLLTIDPLTAFVPPGTNTYHDAEVRRVLRPLADLAQRHRLTALLVRHPTKNTDAKMLYRGGGSIGIIAAARAGFVLAEDPTYPNDATCRVLAATKMNLAKLPRTIQLRVHTVAGDEMPVIRWGDEIDLPADELVHIVRRPSNRRDEAKAFLINLLAAGPVPSTDVIELADDEGISEKTLRRAATDLGVRTHRVGGSDGHHAWSLPTPDEVTNHDTPTSEAVR